MSKQLFEDGKVIEVDGEVLECSAVTYQEDSETQERHSFVYTFRLKSELDAEREEAKKAEEEAEAARQAAEENNPPERQEP